MSRACIFAIAAFVSVLTGFSVATQAAEVKIISGPATDAVLTSLRPEFERTTGNTFESKGGVTGVLKNLIESGEAFDLAIIPGR